MNLSVAIVPIIDTTDEGQLGYRIDYNSDVDVILYSELGGNTG